MEEILDLLRQNARLSVEDIAAKAVWRFFSVWVPAYLLAI